jgi:Na+/proline symporter/nitrogen-specific signal transduction histidine kinase
MIAEILFVPLVALLYLALLFVIAAWGDRSNLQGRRLGGAWVYTLSLAVYCTAWTFFGSVGQATKSGLRFLPYYLGPTIAMFLSAFVLHKMLRIAKAYGITSIADFLAARYGKRSKLGVFATLVALIGMTPYLAVQLKSIATSIDVLVGNGVDRRVSPLADDTALYVAIGLAVFSILFGTRQVDATERHQGLMLAVAFESLVKILVFLAVGAFVVWGIYGGPVDLYDQASAADLLHLLTFEGTGLQALDWILLTLVSGLAFLFLPRQFQIAVIENHDPGHLARAAWAFPAYLLLITLFVMPIALASRLHGLPDGDLAVLDLPLRNGARELAIAAFLGGLSAAAAMVIVETVALSTMVSNDLVVPVLLRSGWLGANTDLDLSRLVVRIRRASIVLIIAVGYAFFRMVGSSFPLAELGMISFVAAAQFGPPILLGLYWRDANWVGALLGLCLGFCVWVYTLLLPTFAVAGILDSSFLESGPFGIDLLRPYAMLTIEGLSPAGHAIWWSLLLNVLGVVLGSLLSHSTGLDRTQAEMFVDVWSRADATRMWRGEVMIRDLRNLLQRFVGPERTAALFAADARRLGTRLPLEGRADARLVQSAERQLARVVGSASARALIGSMVKGEFIGSQSVIEILDETSEVIRYSRELERNSAELERATQDLRDANKRLRELDRLKDDFIATVSHELRTPLTSIRAFSEIVRDNPDLTEEERESFLGVVTRETERLTRLINDILDLSKIESGRMHWRISSVVLPNVVRDAIDATLPLLDGRRVELTRDLGSGDLIVQADPDRLEQVVINLIGNACKFVSADHGRVHVSIEQSEQQVSLRIEDDGPGVPPDQQEAIFGKFIQLGDRLTAKPDGTGLGLSISRQIIEAFGGTLHVEPSRLGGAAFVAVLRKGKHPAEEALASDD